MDKRNKNWTILATILIIICLLATSYYVFFYQENQPKKQEEKEIDDRVSPLTSQAVFFEINRIRRKGIIDHMMNSGSALGLRLVDPLARLVSKLPTPIDDSNIRAAVDGLRPGLGWREKPVFSYAGVFDGIEWIGTRIFFETWDTDYINHEVFQRVEEEQPTTEIEFRFTVDKGKRSLFGLRDTSQIIVDESFSIVYDFKTGRWAGDDYFNDSDGYGHFNGSKYEMWFNVRQTDFDADGIPWWTEVNVLGTDPTVDDSKLDPDGDGVPTSWEWKWGYDPNVWDNHTTLDPDKDGLQNTEEYFMKKWLANPYYPDIYIEADDMEEAPFELELRKEERKILKFIPKIRIRRVYDNWEYIFYEETQQMLMERFNEHGITVHIDDGCMGGGGESVPFHAGYGQSSGFGSEIYKNYFADERKGVFRYVMVGRGGGWCHPQDFRHYYDFIAVPTNEIFYKGCLSYALSQRARRIGQAVQVLHELGHSLGIMPDNITPGCDNTTIEAKEVWDDYESAMNYYKFGARLFDYSDGTHGENDANDWAIIDLTFFQRPSIEMEGLGPPASNS